MLFEMTNSSPREDNSNTEACQSTQSNSNPEVYQLSSQNYSNAETDQSSSQNSSNAGIDQSCSGINPSTNTDQLSTRNDVPITPLDGIVKYSTR